MGLCRLPTRLLTDRITIKRSVQSFVSGTKRPVFEFQVVASDVPSKFVPQSTALNRNTLGQVPTKGFILFLNPIEILENDEVIREFDGKTFVVKEVKDFFFRHLEVLLEEKAA